MDATTAPAAFTVYAEENGHRNAYTASTKAAAIEIFNDLAVQGYKTWIVSAKGNATNSYHPASGPVRIEDGRLVSAA